MIGRGIHLKPRLFQGQPIEDGDEAPHSRDLIFTSIGFNVPPARPTEQMPQAFGMSVGLTDKMRGHTLSTVHVTHTAVGTTIERGATSALSGQGLRHLGATCEKRVSQSVSRR
jgi:hypothetical protein